jgi:hypothetical protein
MLQSLILLLLSCKAAKEIKEQRMSEPLESAELEGTWASSCTEIYTGGSSKFFYVSSLKFFGDKLTLAQESFSDETCKERIITRRFSGVFDSGSPVDVPEGAKSLNYLEINDAVVTIHVSGLVDLYNGESKDMPKICGGGWEVDVDRHLERNECKDTDPERSSYEKVFGIYRVDGATLRTGKFGEHGSDTDGTTAEKRPTELDDRTISLKK